MSRKSLEGQLHTTLGEGTMYKVAAFLIILGLLVGAYRANQSYAWFTDTRNSDYELISGKVHYKVALGTQPGFMVPGKDLAGNIKLTNLSTIDTDVRMRLEYTVWTSSGGIVTSSAVKYVTNASIGGAANPGAADDQYLNLSGGDANSQLSVQQMGDSFPWWANTTTVSAVAYDADTGVVIPEEIPLPFSEIAYDGPKTTNVFAGRPVTLKITLQAKQREHVEWNEITIYETFDDTGA